MDPIKLVIAELLLQQNFYYEKLQKAWAVNQKLQGAELNIVSCLYRYSLPKKTILKKMFYEWIRFS